MSVRGKTKGIGNAEQIIKPKSYSVQVRYRDLFTHHSQPWLSYHHLHIKAPTNTHTHTHPYGKVIERAGIDSLAMTMQKPTLALMYCLSLSSPTPIHSTVSFESGLQWWIHLFHLILHMLLLYTCTAIIYVLKHKDNVFILVSLSSFLSLSQMHTYAHTHTHVHKHTHTHAITHAADDYYNCEDFLGTNQQLSSVPNSTFPLPFTLTFTLTLNLYPNPSSLP